MHLRDKPGVGTVTDHLDTPHDVAERVRALLEAADTFQRNIAIEITLAEGGFNGYHLRSYHEPLTPTDPMTPPPANPQPR